MPIRILIADDHGLVRAGLRALLRAESDISVVGEAANGEDAQKLVKELYPDIVLLDINMPGPDGIEVTRSLKKIAPETKVLVATVHEDESLFQEAIKAGAAGYIVKRAVESELIDAIRAVQRGDIYVHPSMTRALLKDPSASAKPSNAPLESLTPRELDVLRLIAAGYTNRQMADELSISVRTVEGYRANLMSKLDARGRVELVSYARQNNLID
jgi:two-component system response regulator NreC